MANVWVGTDYYIPSIDQSGDTFKVSIHSTTTSNTYIYETIKDSVTSNSESVGAAQIVWIDGFGHTELIEHATSSDNSRRLTIAPSSTNSTNGEGLVVEYALGTNGNPEDMFSNHYDTANVANLISYHVSVGGTGWVEQDEITFTNIDGGHYEDLKRQENLSQLDGKTEEEGQAMFKALEDTPKPNQRNNYTGNIAWTDKNGPCFFTGTPEINLASNATFHVNAMIRAGTWTP